MKTTLNLDDRLFKLAKKEAAERGITLTSIVEDGLRAVLFPPANEKPFKLRLPVIKGGSLPDVDIADRNALYDRMEGRH
ncbi:MAG: DUF2191 domain-containing protein [Actinomycetota bacterium]